MTTSGRLILIDWRWNELLVQVINYQKCSIRWINWNQKLKNLNIFCWCKWKLDNFFINFEQGGQENISLEGGKISCPLYSKCVKKSKCQQQQNLVFSFSFWFQFIKRIEQKSLFFNNLPNIWQICFFHRSTVIYNFRSNSLIER